MGIELSKVVKSLKRKGFEEDPERKGQDHQWFRLYVNGRKTHILTKVSRGKKKYRDLGPDLVKSMASQVCLSVPQFKDLVSCTLSGEDYVEVLEDAGNNFSPHPG